MIEQLGIPLIMIVIFINIPIYVILGKVLFHDLEGFLYSISFLGKSDLLSFFKGDFLTDVYHEIKLVLFAAIPGAT